MKLTDTTFLVKSFLRPNCLARLLLSIHRHYPRTPTIVVDDSGNDDALEVCRPYSWVKLITTAEKDVGISKGRNIGLLEVQTKYFVLLDDDCLFWIMSDVPLMKQRLEENGADIVCGPMYFMRMGTIQQSAMDFLELDGRHILVKADLALGEEGWVKLSNNFFIARTELRKRVLWPDKIKTDEHAPFFWLVHQTGGKVWTSHYSSIAHLRSDNAEYRSYRDRIKNQTDDGVIAACQQFRDVNQFYWFTEELEKEFGETCCGKEIGWRRVLSPRCDTERKFIEFAMSKNGDERNRVE